jgi:hypothetical protein
VSKQKCARYACTLEVYPEMYYECGTCGNFYCSLHLHVDKEPVTCICVDCIKEESASGGRA